jgi:voltage-gated sodium channel
MCGCLESPSSGTSFTTEDDEPDAESEALCLIIKTSPEGRNLGRVYTYRAESREAFVRWKHLFNEAGERAKRKRTRDLWEERYPTPFTKFRARVGEVYDSRPAQWLLSMVVLFSYCTDVAETEYWPEDGTNLAWLFDTMDRWTSIAFTVELGVNIFANSERCFRPFVSDPWNLVDVLIVGATLMSAMGISSYKPPRILRLIRVARILKLVRRVPSLSRIVSALGHSIGPVCNSFFLLFIFTSVYATIATHAFKDRSQQFFGTFSASFFSLFQVVTTDSWASSITRSLFHEDGAVDTAVAFFFVSYVLVASIVLVNIVVAVLLDEFIASVTARKEAEERQQAQERETEWDEKRITGVLDPLTSSLTLFNDNEDLTNMVANLFSKLDVDGSGGLTYEEFKERVKKVTPTPVFLNHDDFDIITEHGILCDAAGEFGRTEFQAMMRGEMKNYAQRQMASAMEWTQSRESKSIMLMLKILGISVETIASQVRELHTKNFGDKGKMHHTGSNGHGEYGAVLQELSEQIQTLIRAQHDQADKLDRLLKRKHPGDVSLPSRSLDGGAGAEEGAQGESEVEARLTAAAEVLCDVQDAIEVQDGKLDKMLSMMAAADERHAPLAPLVDALRNSTDLLQQEGAHAASKLAEQSTQPGACETDGAEQREADEETALLGGSFPSSPHTPQTPVTVTPTHRAPSEKSGGDRKPPKQVSGSGRSRGHKKTSSDARGDVEHTRKGAAGGNIDGKEDLGSRNRGDGSAAGSSLSEAGAGVEEDRRVPAAHAVGSKGGGHYRHRRHPPVRDTRHAPVTRVTRVDNGCDTVLVPGYMVFAWWHVRVPSTLARHFALLLRLRTSLLREIKMRLNPPLECPATRT